MTVALSVLVTMTILVVITVTVCDGAAWLAGGA
jgi:hypothetical protein